MKILIILCRILLGLIFVVFGLNGFFHFIPAQMPPADSPVGQWFGVMMASGWMHVISAVQVIGGLLVLAGVTVPLGLAMLVPVTFNILCFHVLLTGSHGVMPGVGTGILEVVLAYYYRPYLRGIFSTRAEPVFTRTI